MRKIIALYTSILCLSLCPLLAVAQWQQTNATGITRGILINGDDIYAGTTNVGLLISHDAGNTWVARDSGFIGQNVGPVVIYGAYLFAGTGAGVYLSQDSGLTWTSRSNGLPTGTSIYGLERIGSKLFAGMLNHGVYISSDSGRNWSAVNTGLSNLNVITLKVHGTKIYAGTGADVFVSANNGGQWTSLGTGFTTGNIFIGAISFIGNRIFAGANMGLFVSDDSGTTWVQDSTGLPTVQVTSIAGIGANLYAGTYYKGVYTSADSGRHWQPFNTGLQDSLIWGLDVRGSELFAATANPGGVWKIATGSTCGPAPAQALCMVTCDTAHTQNTIIWEKADKHATDSFYLYRADTPDSVYVQIAAIGRDSLSIYNDISAQPDLMSYRYKINLKDTCGNYSALSAYHQTILLQYTGAGQFSWTPYTVESANSPVIGYDLYRDAAGNGNWQLLASVANNQTTSSDPNYTLYPNARYKVNATLANSCNPARAFTIISSNVVVHVLLSIEDIQSAEITITPNPTRGKFDIAYTDAAAIRSVEVSDQLGRKLQVTTTTGQPGIVYVDLGELSADVYYVTVNYENTSMTRRIVKY